MTEQIFTVMELRGKRDPMCGGHAADWGLYTTEDKQHVFMGAAEAQRLDLVKAYFPTEKEGKAAGEGASLRNGLISVLPVPRDPRIPVAQLRWIVGNMHVGTSDEDLTADIVARSEGWPLGQYADYVAQACAYAFASHRTNQGLYAQLRFEVATMTQGVCKRCGGGFWESEKAAREEGLCDECEGKPAPNHAARRSVEVFDIPSGFGGSHTVEVVEELQGSKVRLRVWYGRATATGWEPWKDWDGYRFDADRAELKNKRTMPLFK